MNVSSCRSSPFTGRELSQSWPYLRHDTIDLSHPARNDLTSLRHASGEVRGLDKVATEIAPVATPVFTHLSRRRAPDSTRFSPTPIIQRYQRPFFQPLVRFLPFMQCVRQMTNVGLLAIIVLIPCFRLIARWLYMEIIVHLRKLPSIAEYIPLLWSWQSWPGCSGSSAAQLVVDFEHYDSLQIVWRMCVTVAPPPPPPPPPPPSDEANPSW